MDKTDIAGLTCWIVTDGKAGTENQCIGLANALGINPVIKRIDLRAPWRIFTPFLKGLEQYAFSPKGDQLNGPWPDILIASGRRSLPAVFAARKAKGRNIFIIQLQDPRCDHKYFDLIVAPHHDQLDGSKVISTMGALNKITNEQIQTAVKQQAKRFAGLAPPLTAIMIGGSSSAYRLDTRQMNHIIEQFEQLLWKTPGSLVITTSRRTGEANYQLIKKRLGNHPRVWLWDRVSENPYFALLGLASTLMVTADSVSMVSEAATTGKPIYVIPIDGGSKRFDRFHANFFRAGITRPFAGNLEYWDYEPLNETQNVAGYVKKLLQERFLNV